MPDVQDDRQIDARLREIAEGTKADRWIAADKCRTVAEWQGAGERMDAAYSEMDTLLGTQSNGVKEAWKDFMSDLNGHILACDVAVTSARRNGEVREGV